MLFLSAPPPVGGMGQWLFDKSPQEVSNGTLPEPALIAANASVPAVQVDAFEFARG
jgi:hypothetical protein